MSIKDKLKEVLGEEWFYLLEDEIDKGYLEVLLKKIQERRSIIDVLPRNDEIFKAYKLTPPSAVKVVALGQDPYPTPNNAHGLAFSTLDPELTPSLKNIFLEIYRDVYDAEGNIGDYFRTGNLYWWTQRGVFLLNRVLTVDKGKSLSHKGKGWEQFTKRTIEILNQREKPIVFMLWGKEARELKSVITNKQHLVLEAAHPVAEAYSPGAGFFGCKHFSKANEFLIANNQQPISWETYEEDEPPF